MIINLRFIMQQTAQIARDLIQHLRKKEFLQATENLFSNDAESHDPLRPELGTIRGLDTLMAMEKDFLSRAEIGSIEISEPICSGDYFSIRLLMHFSVNGKDRVIDELCVYKTKDQKIISQQFFIS